MIFRRIVFRIKPESAEPWASKEIILQLLENKQNRRREMEKEDRMGGPALAIAARATA